MGPAVELARRAGDRAWETGLLSGEISLFISLGHWREAIERVQEIEASEDSLSAGRSVYEVLLVAEVYVQRGDLATARRMVERAASFADSTDDVQVRGVYACCLSLLLRKEGDLEPALAAAEVAIQAGDKLGSGSPIFKLGTVAAIEAALELGEDARADHLLRMIEQLAPGEASPFLRAQGLRLRARLSADDDADTSKRLAAAAAIFRELSTPFWLAVTLFEHASWLLAQDRTVEAEPLLGEARVIFEQLEARPFLDRIAGAANRETIPA